MKNQAQFIQKFNEEHREKFNPKLFERSEDDIIDALKRVILSCERDKFFTIKVMSFEVVEDYKEIKDILYQYEDDMINKKDKFGQPIKPKKEKPKKRDNKYDFIDLKDSDIKLLIVKYFVKIKDEQDIVRVIIAVPRIVDKFYFRLSGNIYSAMYQIVDASTYNNSTSSSNYKSVTLKTMFQPIKMYKYEENLRSTKKDALKCTVYKANIFSKTILTAEYIFAKCGFYNALKFMNMPGAIRITTSDPNNDTLYTFVKKDNDGIFVSVPKYLFDNDYVVQTMVSTVIKSINKDTKYSDMFTKDFWVSNLGSHFNMKNSLPKGLSVLDSLEFIYDDITKESIHLPEENKRDIYHILKWMMGEFNALNIKDNLNISTKKIRCAEYIASLYAMKLSTGIYRISDKGKRADIKTIRKSIITSPMYLLGEITKCQLVNYRNVVSDIDSLVALKFTYKGVSGIGEKGSNAIPSVYRLVDYSNLGRVDPDSSSATDPGITGTICPLVELTEDMHFTEFKEPNSWETGFKKTMDAYKSLVGLKEVFVMKEQLGIDTGDVVKEEVEESIEVTKKLMNPIIYHKKDDLIHGLPLEAGGTIYYG